MIHANYVATVIKIYYSNILNTSETNSFSHTIYSYQYIIKRIPYDLNTYTTYNWVEIILAVLFYEYLRLLVA